MTIRHLVLLLCSALSGCAADGGVWEPCLVAGLRDQSACAARLHQRANDMAEVSRPIPHYAPVYSSPVVVWPYEPPPAVPIYREPMQTTCSRDYGMPGAFVCETH